MLREKGNVLFTCSNSLTCIGDTMTLLYLARSIKFHSILYSNFTRFHEEIAENLKIAASKRQEL